MTHYTQNTQIEHMHASILLILIQPLNCPHVLCQPRHRFSNFRSYYRYLLHERNLEKDESEPNADDKPLYNIQIKVEREKQEGSDERN